jgi:hypothetical protein
MRDRRDSQKKRFIETLKAQGTVYHAAQAAGISRWTAYRWRQDDAEFADRWDDSIEDAVDAVESVLYQKALAGDVVSMIFYLKAHRPKYRDRLAVDLNAVNREIEQRVREMRAQGYGVRFLSPGLVSITEPPRLQLSEGETSEA